MLKIKDHNNLVRDPASKAIINIDDAGLSAYMQKKESMRIRNEQISKNTKAVEELKSDIKDIKEMMLLLLNKIK